MADRAEMEAFWQRWLDTNRDAEKAGDWTRARPTSTPRTRPMAGTAGRTSTSWRSAASEIRELALGLEMHGLDGWNYPYQATVIDDKPAWSSASGSRLPTSRRPTARAYEVAGIGGSWFGYADGAMDLAARLLRPRQRRRDVPRDDRPPASLSEGMTARIETAMKGKRAPGHYRDQDLPGAAMADDAIVTGCDQLLIGGKLVDRSATARSSRPINPATEEVLGMAADASPRTWMPRSARPAARSTRTDWSTRPQLRARCLRQLRDALEDQVEELRALTMAEVGRAGHADQRRAPRRSGRATSAGRPTSPRAYQWSTDLGVATPMGIASRRTVVREAPVWSARSRRGTSRIRSTSPSSGRRWRAGCTVVLKAAPDTPWCASCSAGSSPSTPTSRRVSSTSSRRATTRSVRSLRPIRGSTWSASPARPRPGDRHGRRRAHAEEGLPRARRQVGLRSCSTTPILRRPAVSRRSPGSFTPAKAAR